MNDKNKQNERLEELLRRAHMPEPSMHLKERITAAAKKVWNQESLELPWLIPFRFLAASAAAAIVIIWLANYTSDYSLDQWSFGLVRTASQRPAEIEALPEMPYGPFVRRLVSDNRRSSMIDASALNDHAEALRQVLDEIRQNGIAEPPAPTGDRSLLIPNPSSDNSYS